MKFPFLIILFFLFSCSQEHEVKSGMVSPQEFQAAMNADEDFVLLDVRTPEEYADGHLKGAVNIDFHQEDFSDKIDQLDREKTYYVYCRTDNRSGKTAAMMEEMNFQNVIYMKGGINAWKEEGKEVE